MTDILCKDICHTFLIWSTDNAAKKSRLCTF